MKILLLYPQYTHSSEFDSRAPSMSLLYLASALEREGHEVKIFDASLGPIVEVGKVFRYGVGDDDKTIYNMLAKEKIGLVGITCSFTSRWKFVSKLARQIKEQFPDIPIATGGLYPTSEWEYCLNDCSVVDIIMQGEAELSFAKIANNLASGLDVNESCSSVDGVAWRHKEEFFYNPKKGYNTDLDNLSYPAWHLADLEKYFRLQRNIFELQPPCLPILSSRGCPNHCTFCNMYLTHGHQWRHRSAKNVLDEIEYLIKRFNVRNFYFIDDNFSLNLERAKKICSGIIERKLKIKYNFHNGLSIKAIDKELVALMKESGCTSVCLAVESGSERIRNEVYGKKLRTESIVNAFNWYREKKIPTIGYFMVGAPGETNADIKKTKELMAKLPMSLATVGIYTPYPGTKLYDQCVEKGWLVELDVKNENRVELFSSMIRTPDFEPKDVAKWQKELYLSFAWHHWPGILKEWLRPGGVVNLDMFGKFIRLLKFHN